MSEKKDEIPDLKIEFSDVAQMAEDPEIASAIREFVACFHQALQGVKEGRYPNFEDALESITGTRPVRIDDDDC